MAVQVFAKEEELAEFQAKLGERDTALKAYKTENSRFADMRDKFKADIASLQQQVRMVMFHVAYHLPHLYTCPSCSASLNSLRESEQAKLASTKHT